MKLYLHYPYVYIGRCVIKHRENFTYGVSQDTFTSSLLAREGFPPQTPTSLTRNDRNRNISGQAFGKTQDEWAVSRTVVAFI